MYHIIPIIQDMFHELELDEECAEIIDKFSGVTADRDNTWNKNLPNQIQMGTKVFEKGPKSKSSTTTSQSNCSSKNPLNPIRENGEMDVPELVDDNENVDSRTGGDQQSQPLITFGQACLNDMGATTENLGQSINVTFEVDNENSRKTPQNPHVLLNDVSQEQLESD